jgi:hypothetical protein
MPLRWDDIKTCAQKFAREIADACAGKTQGAHSMEGQCIALLSLPMCALCTVRSDEKMVPDEKFIA